MKRTIVALALAGSVALSVCGCRRAAAPDREPAPRAGATPAASVQPAPPAPRADSGPAATPRHLPACELISRDEMSGLAGGPIGKPSGESSERETTCTYPPADAGSYAQAEITIEWDHGPQPSLERQLAGAFSASALGRRVAHEIELGDEAAYSMEGVLSIRSGRTLITVSLPMRPGAEEHAIAIGRKLCERLGITTAPRVPATAHTPPLAARAESSTQEPVAARQTDMSPPVAQRPPPPAPGFRVVADDLTIGGECPAAPVAPAASGPRYVPLVVGLTLGHVWKPHSDSGTDEYECLIQVTDITPAYADVTYTCNGRDEVPRRRLCMADLRASRVYLTESGLDQPPVVSGATMFSLSSRSFEELKSTGDTAHRYIEIGTEWQTRPKPLTKDTEGNLHSGRFDRETYKVIVNDKTVELPVLTGIAFRDKHRQTLVTVLDDPGLPLVLDYQVPGEEFELRYTKISFPTRGDIEKHLAVDKRVDVYGIYFDFASDHLRPESAPVLREIADALTKHADWTLSVNGHTDSVGGDAANLALSRRRSDAVRKALADQYKIDPARLATAGFGASQPKAPNDTVEGRALNRRVELVRQ
ncbi:MAG TPA: OmpA family protein [Vicinamibacterales bacterium]